MTFWRKDTENGPPTCMLRLFASAWQDPPLLRAAAVLIRILCRRRAYGSIHWGSLDLV